MKFSYYLLFSLFILAAGCGSEDDDPIEPSGCDKGTVEGLRCALSSTTWQLVSVRSDKERISGTGSNGSKDWLDFQPTCYGSSESVISGFVPIEGDTLLSTWNVLNIASNCSSRTKFSLKTTDFLETATVLYGRGFSLYMFGDSIAPAVIEEKWYDINYSEDSFTFSVDKSLDSIDYRVDVELARVR